MTFSFHPDAEAEFREAIEYYESCKHGLGEDFSVEVGAAIRRIIDFPNAWPVLEGDVRRCRTHRFPYAVAYSVEKEEVLILAVMHLRRNPDYWKYRR
jgi:plasmid stabilization system protein ParE